MSFVKCQNCNRVKLKFFVASKYKSSQAQVFKTKILPSRYNNYFVYINDCIKFESSLGSTLFSRRYKNTYELNKPNYHITISNYWAGCDKRLFKRKEQMVKLGLLLCYEECNNIMISIVSSLLFCKHSQINQSLININMIN